MVAAELARLQERERFLENELRAMQTRGMSSPGRLDEETVTTLLGEEAARVLSTARDASLQIRERAEESATRLVKDAAEDASRIREAANLEAARIREDAATDAESEIEMAKQQGRDMVTEAREYREKVLSELSRRRDAAREQIDKLLHGRDRLINAFERARIASESVIGELTDSHDEPEFIVDLSPTTGPVPVVNPAHPSFTPSVKIFDREAEDSEPSMPRSSAPTQRTTTSSVIDIPIDEPAPDLGRPSTPMGRAPFATGAPSTTDGIDEVMGDVTVEERLVVVEDSVTVVADEGVTGLDATDEAGTDLPSHATTTDVVADETEEDETTPSNVVSLFGRGRRPGEPTVVAETPVLTPTVDQVGEFGVSESEPEAPIDDTPAKAEGHALDSVLDDIFAKLRGTTTAEVARMASADEPTKAESPSAAESPTVAAGPAKAARPTSKPTVSTVHSAVTIDEKVLASREDMVERLSPTIARRLKRVLADEQNSVLEHLRVRKSSLEPDAMLGGVDAHATRYAVAITSEVMEAAGVGAKTAKGSTRRVTADDLVAGTTATMIRFIVEAFRSDICTVTADETDRAVLAERVRDVYRSWKSDRIDSIVADITRSAYSHGVILSLEPGASVRWTVSPDGCCSDCEDNSLAGAQSAGAEFPAGQVLTPAHQGCRCQVWPVRN